MRIITLLFVVLMFSFFYSFGKESLRNNIFKPEYTGCSVTISSFPYTESFVSGWGNWTEHVSSNIWQRLSVATPSTSTGPSAAYDGSYYLFTEASSPNYPDKLAIVESPCFDLTQENEANFQFHYHMYGAFTGTLSLQVSISSDTTWTTLWERTGEQGDLWYQANVDLSAYIGETIKVRFYARTGLSYTSDMAIDTIQLVTTPISGGTTCSTTISTFPYNESFESSWGDWDEEVSMNIWQRNSGSTSSGLTVHLLLLPELIIFSPRQVVQTHQIKQPLLSVLVLI
ncbi:MAG: hypothetical protein IPJ74_08610 [Saprospiraceae bacterium]|nr:hypothetical protein [Saprospiraceae bacterium]